MKILVVDDSLLARMSLIKVLKTFEPDAQILEADNGQKAVDMYKSYYEDIRLIFLDLTMPVMNGFEALEEIMKVNPKAKVVVVSADIQQKAQQKVLELGGITLIPKPISEDKMRELLISGLI